MRGTSFIRVETYARHRSKLGNQRKSTVSEVIEEVGRVEGRREHVDDIAKPEQKVTPGPREPILVAGVPPTKVKDRIDQEVDARRRHREPTPRRDAHVMAGFLVSTPVTPRAYVSDRQLAKQVDRFLTASLRFLRAHVESLGGAIASAVVHWDEGYMHLHVLSTPSGTTDYRADRLHPGKAAKKQALASGAYERTANARAKEALSEFMTLFHRQVSERFGLVRPEPYETYKVRSPRARIVRERNVLYSQQANSTEHPGVTASNHSKRSDDGGSAIGGRPLGLEDFLRGRGAEIASAIEHPRRDRRARLLDPSIYKASTLKRGAQYTVRGGRAVSDWSLDNPVLNTPFREPGRHVQLTKTERRRQSSKPVAGEALI